MKKYIILCLSGVVILMMILVVSEYFFWPNRVGLQIAAVFHLPIAKINETTFSINDFLADQKSISIASETKDLSQEEKNSLVVEKIKQEGVINSLIKQFNLEIKPDDIANLKQKLLTGTDDKTLSNEEIKRNFGYSRDDFTRRVVIPYYYRLQLQKYYILNTENSDKEKISEFRDKISKEPQNFDSQVKILSGQEPIEHIVAQSDLTGDYEHIVSVPVGGISAIVANADGYRLYQVKNIIKDDKEQTYYQLHELFVPTTIFQEKLNEAIAQAREKWYIKKPQMIAVR